MSARVVHLHDDAPPVELAQFVEALAELLAEAHLRQAPLPEQQEASHADR